MRFSLTTMPYSYQRGIMGGKSNLLLNGLMNQVNMDKERAVKRPVHAAWRFHLMLFFEKKNSYYLNPTG